MRFRAITLLICGLCASLPAVLAADEPKPAEPDVQKAVTRGIAVLEKAAARYPEHRNCFSCHHQTLPMLGLNVARARGFKVDDKLFAAQAEFTQHTFDGLTKSMKEGKGVGGRAMTVGYGLWTYVIADTKPGETTEAMVTYLLKTQREEGHWTGQVNRPPLEDSYVTCTVLAIQGMKRYAGESQRQQVNAAIAKAETWLATAATKGQEDKASRLWGLWMLGLGPDKLSAAKDAVLKAQRADGGWAQLDEMESDAYATGQTLYVLHAVGVGPKDVVYQRGVKFLLKTQRPDGAWLVVTRSKPIQAYFNSDDEDPLGKNQFIAIPATGWAVAALAVTVDPPR